MTRNLVRDVESCSTKRKTAMRLRETEARQCHKVERHLFHRSGWHEVQGHHEKRASKVRVGSKLWSREICGEIKADTCRSKIRMHRRSSRFYEKVSGTNQEIMRIALLGRRSIRDPNDLTVQLPDFDGCYDMKPSMHKVSVQEVASSLDAIELTFVNKMNGVVVWYSVGAYFAQQSAAPHRSPVNAGSSITGMLEVIERDSTESLAELALAGYEAENGSNLSNGSSVWNSVGVSFAHQPAAPEDHWSPGTAGSTKMRVLELSESECTKNLMEPSIKEDAAENGYQQDTQEDNVTKASNANLREVCTENDLSNSSWFQSSHDTQQDSLSRFRNLLWVEFEQCYQMPRILNSEVCFIRDGLSCDCRVLVSLEFGFRIWNSFNDEHYWWKLLGPCSFSVRFPECFQGCVAESSGSSVQEKLRGRRQHLRGREWLHLRVCQCGKWEDHHWARQRAWRGLHDGLREDDQRRDKQQQMRQITENSYNIEESWKKNIDPARHDVPRTPWKSDEWKVNNRRKTTLEQKLRLICPWHC